MWKNKTSQILLTGAIITVSIIIFAALGLAVQANQEPLSWTIETVEGGEGRASYPSLVLDTVGNPHISYYEHFDGPYQDHYNLKYAKWTGSEWEIELVDNQGFVGQYNSLALDSNNYPHISYLDSSNDYLKYAYWTGTEWHIEVVDDEKWGPTSLVLDGNDRPHIGYSSYNSLKYAYWDGLSWQIEVVASGATVEDISLVLDAAGNPRISYVTSSYSLGFAEWTGSNWQLETIYNAGQAGLDSSLALDTVDNPHIAYFDPANNNIKYAFRVNGIWSFQVVDVAISGGVSLALDQANMAHIGYKQQNSTIHYARWRDSFWEIELVDNQGYPIWPSLALDGAGNPHLSYNSLYPNYDLRYATASSAPPFTPSPTATATATATATPTFTPSSTPAPTATPLSWLFERIDVHKHFDYVGDRTVAIDNVGNLHLAYGGDSLYYARYNGIEWQLETVDSSLGVGTYLSLALDEQNRPHISYYDFWHGALKYARWTGIVWEIQTVATSAGPYNAIALDSAGNPHIAFGPSLRYARWLNNQWVITAVGGGGGMFLSLALDGDDKPHISSYMSNDDVLVYTHWTGTGWQYEFIDSAGAAQTSLAVDGDGKPHIVYLDDTSGTWVKYAHLTNRWEIESITDSHWDSFSLLLDELGNPHISFVNSGQVIGYAYRTGGVWESQDVISSGAFVTGLVRDGAGNPSIGYLTGYAGSVLEVARWSGSEWEFDQVDQELDGWGRTSLGLDPAGSPQILYTIYTTNRLKYGRWAGNSWELQELATLYWADLSYSSMALDGAGKPHLAYFDDVGLQYVYWDNDSWESELVYAGNGDQPWLAVTENGEPRLIFSLYNGLYYGYRVAGEWQLELITPEVGFEGRLALDESGNPHLTYSLGSQLKYAQRVDGSWQIEVIDSSGVSYFHSIAVDSSGRVHIAHANLYGQLKYSYWTGNNWQSEIVENNYNVRVRYPSLALDSTNNPFIAYFDDENDDLRYAFRLSNQWQTQIVDNLGNVGIFNALLLDENNQPHISYVDVSNGDVKYAAAVPLPAATPTAIATATPTTTATPTAIATATPTTIATTTPTATATPTAIATATPTTIATTTPTATVTPTAIATTTPSLTIPPTSPSPTITATLTPTPIFKVFIPLMMDVSN